MVFGYIIFSRLYSYRGVRLKKYPFVGYITVITNQGGLVFLMVYVGCGGDTQHIPWPLVATATLLVGGFYPITQVYQHQQDKKDGVMTLSRVLGKRGTFHFCAIVYIIAFCILAIYLSGVGKIMDFIVAQFFFLPIAILFIKWYIVVYKDEAKAAFKHTMQMNLWASSCTNLAFITVLVLHHFQ
jgi:1,4-dihydroxy-2-naphthoate octaprenyltransferase